jgi:hypothetical protein
MVGSWPVPGRGRQELYLGAPRPTRSRWGAVLFENGAFMSPSAAWRPQPSGGDSAAPLRLGPTGHLTCFADRDLNRDRWGVCGTRRLTQGAAIRSHGHPAFRRVRERWAVCRDRGFEPGDSERGCPLAGDRGRCVKGPVHRPARRQASRPPLVLRSGFVPRLPAVLQRLRHGEFSKLVSRKCQPT